jgi:hypothetical protein
LLRFSCWLADLRRSSQRTLQPDDRVFGLASCGEAGAGISGSILPVEGLGRESDE